MNGAPPPPPRPRPCAQPGAVAVWQLYGHCRSVPRAPGPGCKLRSLSLAPARLRTRRSALLSFAVRRSRVPSPCLQLLARHTLASLTRSSRLRPTPLSHGGPIISCSKPASATLFLPPFCLAPAATVCGHSSRRQQPLARPALSMAMSDWIYPRHHGPFRLPQCASPHRPLLLLLAVGMVHRPGVFSHLPSLLSSWSFPQHVRDRSHCALRCSPTPSSTATGSYDW